MVLSATPSRCRFVAKPRRNACQPCHPIWALVTAGAITSAVTKAQIGWHGWHAFRRGLATNLHRLGVADKTIQRILRHSSVAVTQACYIKTADSEAAAAMRQFGLSLEYAPNMHRFGAERFPLM